MVDCAIILEKVEKIYKNLYKYMKSKGFDIWLNNLIFKLKEVWLYLVNSYENNAKLIKKIKKIKNINEYKSFIRELN